MKPYFMLVIDLNLNIFLVAGLVLSSGILGYVLGTMKKASLQNKVGELEKEMLNSHAEILQLQRDKIDLIKSVSEPSGIPVISINGKDEKGLSLDKNQEAVLRKKVVNPPLSAGNK